MSCKYFIIKWNISKNRWLVKYKFYLINNNLNSNDYEVIVAHCIKKLLCKQEKWRKILKNLFLIEHILKTGNPRFANSMREESSKIKNLKNFSYIDENKVDKGETSKKIYKK